jgi:hypothetical protein
MGDSRTHGDQGLPWLEAANDENGTRRDLAAKMLWTLFALLLISSVAVVSYVAGRGSRQEPLEPGGETVQWHGRSRRRCPPPCRRLLPLRPTWRRPRRSPDCSTPSQYDDCDGCC